MPVSNRGFASMTPERRKEIASQGGKAVHAQGKAHQWTGGPEGTAKIAGRKGGRVSRGGGRKTDLCDCGFPQSHPVPHAHSRDEADTLDEGCPNG